MSLGVLLWSFGFLSDFFWPICSMIVVWNSEELPVVAVRLMKVTGIVTEKPDLLHPTTSTRVTDYWVRSTPLFFFFANDRAGFMEPRQLDDLVCELGGTPFWNCIWRYGLPSRGRWNHWALSHIPILKIKSKEQYSMFEPCNLYRRPQPPSNGRFAEHSRMESGKRFIVNNSNGKLEKISIISQNKNNRDTTASWTFSGRKHRTTSIFSVRLGSLWRIFTRSGDDIPKL